MCVCVCVWGGGGDGGVSVSNIVNIFVYCCILIVRTREKQHWHFPEPNSTRGWRQSPPGNTTQRVQWTDLLCANQLLIMVVFEHWPATPVFNQSQLIPRSVFSRTATRCASQLLIMVVVCSTSQLWPEWWKRRVYPFAGRDSSSRPRSVETQRLRTLRLCGIYSYQEWYQQHHF